MPEGFQKRIRALRKILKRLSRRRVRPGRPKELCADCSQPLSISKKVHGMGYCVSCGSSWAVAIGRVVSEGMRRHQFVYTRAGLMAEFRESSGNDLNAGEDLKQELLDKKIVVIEFYEED